MESEIEQVVKKALELSALHLSDFSSVKSRKDFTQPQLMALVILRLYLKIPYRTLVSFVSSQQRIRTVLGIKDKLPHYTTLQKFSAREEIVKAAEIIMQSLEKDVR